MRKRARVGDPALAPARQSLSYGRRLYAYRHHTAPCRGLLLLVVIVPLAAMQLLLLPLLLPPLMLLLMQALLLLVVVLSLQPLVLLLLPLLSSQLPMRQLRLPPPPLLPLPLQMLPRLLAPLPLPMLLLPMLPPQLAAAMHPHLRILHSLSRAAYGASAHRRRQAYRPAAHPLTPDLCGSACCHTTCVHGARIRSSAP